MEVVKDESVSLGAFPRHSDIGPDHLEDAKRDMGDIHNQMPVSFETLPAPAADASLSEVDLLKYNLLLERIQRVRAERQLAYTNVQRLSALEEQSGNDLGELLDALGIKYNTDFHKHSINRDTGQIVRNT